MTSSAGEWTLTEAARLLGTRQHRLIYLCEKGVVEPDLKQAEGRGSSRLFSARNLLEFAVALRLRDLEIAASLVGAVIHVMRAFEQTVRKQIPDFRLPESLRQPRAADLRVVIGDGRRLFFTLGPSGLTPKVYGGIELEPDAPRKSVRALGRELARAKPRPAAAPRERSGNPREAGTHAWK